MRTKTDILNLFFYREPFGPTVMEHLQSIGKYSSFSVMDVNLAEPDATDRLRKIDAQVITLHYTLFAMQYYLITEEQAYIVGESPALKVAFFQDEYYHCPKRFRFIDEYAIDIVYTLLEPQQFCKTYISRSSVPVVLQTLAGYVSDHLLEVSATVRHEKRRRDIDVGYRGHELDITYGKAGQEKAIIGQEFKRRTQGQGLRLDIETSVAKRIYGEAWFRFIANCRAMLGVEAGVSAFDLEDDIRLSARALRRANPDISNEELWEKVVAPYENNIPYRTISPRHFEAAALGTAQILFEGTYTGLMEPWRHYIPLQRDFSNLNQVLGVLRDDDALRKIAQTARRDLIDSGRFHYREFVMGFDRHLRLMGCKPASDRSRK